MTRYSILLTLISQFCFGQTNLPTRDTLIKVKEGFIKFKVYPHAVFATTTTKEGIPHGPFRSYYRDGKIWSEYNNNDGKIDGEFKAYTRDGKLVKIQEWRKGTLFKEKIFYSSSLDKPQKYYHVSDTGYVTFLNGKQVHFNSSTPDSVIEQAPGGEYMWIKGARQVYSGKPFELPRQKK